MGAMTVKMDAQYKEIQSKAKKTKPDLDEDEIPMSREEEAKFMQTFRKTRFYNDYLDRDLNRDNWRSNERSSYNRDNYRSNTNDKPYDLQKQFNDFMKSKQSTNAFVKETFMDLKTQLETVAKNHQALIQNLETKFDRLADKQSGRPFRSFPSNTQPNPKGHNSKAYQPPQSRNEHVNAVFTRSEEDFDTLLDEGSKILHSIEGTLLEEEIFYEFDEFMTLTTDENSESESDTEEPPFEKIIINTDYKIKTSLEEPPTNLELKPLPDNLEYKHKEAFAWKMTDIPGICPSFCKHKIQLLDDKKPVVQKQRRLNPNMQEVVKKGIIKLLDTGIIYLIADSPWVSPIYCVPKKGGITVVTNENDELVPTRTVMGWRVCIDYRKLNEATAKDHFPLPFIDQMLERLACNKYLCFLDGFSGYFQIPINPNDQEKTTFTCPFGTYAYRQMPFGLCNAPATFEDFSKIAKPLTKLLEKDIPFEFDDECQKAFKLLKEKLTCAPVIVRPNWNLPFKLMRDASDFAVGAILGQKDEFNKEIKDRKGTENVAADHLSRIENDETSDDSEVDDNFSRETLMEINTKDEPWFADFAIYLVGDIIPKGMTYQQKNKFFSDLKHYFWEGPYLFKLKHKQRGSFKRILEKTVKDNPAICLRKLDVALWAFRTEYKTPTGTTPYKLIYGKNCHLPFEIEHRAYWPLKNCNPDLITAG
ncbi:reverse transcriptase domain-containing protein [Tanacetum coccineum]